MRDSVPNARYFSVCNVLRQWSISLIPTYIESTDSMITCKKNFTGLILSAHEASVIVNEQPSMVNRYC